MRRRRKRSGPPPTIPSLLGPVPTTRVSDLRDKNGEPCFGIWTNEDRQVRFNADMCDTAAWHTYWHEWVHIVLWDAGVKLTETATERVCDAIATARVHEQNQERNHA